MMNPKKPALGKGLSALLGTPEAIQARNSQAIDAPVKQPSSGHTCNVHIEDIEVNPFQPRTEFEQEPLEELMESIMVMGIIQPVTLRILESGKYQLISGERRLRASKMAGLKSIPAYIRTVNDDEMLQLALVENIQRENLNAIEVAISYQRLMDECNLTQEILSKKVGKNRTTISNFLRLLRLPAEIQFALKLNKISMGHARALISIESEERRLEIFDRIIEEELSVRKVEELVRNADSSKAKLTKKQELPEKHNDIQSRLTENLRTKIQIRRSANGKGAISIAFKSDEHLEEILELLKLNA